MHQTILVLACLAGIGCSRRVQSSPQEGALDASSAFARLLLASDSGAAFRPSHAGAIPFASRVSNSRLSQAQMVDMEVVKKMRSATGAGLSACKKALREADGDYDKAMEAMRQEGILKAGKRSGKSTANGLIHSYIHAGSKLGIMLEVNCETDFAARTDVFKELAANLAMQITIQPDLQYVSMDTIPATVVEKLKAEQAQADDLSGKPDNIKAKIIEGRIQKLLKSKSLLDSIYYKDETLTIEDYLKDRITILGENIKVSRFERFVLGGAEDEEEQNVAEPAAQETVEAAVEETADEANTVETEAAESAEEDKAAAEAQAIANAFAADFGEETEEATESAEEDRAAAEAQAIADAFAADFGEATEEATESAEEAEAAAEAAAEAQKAEEAKAAAEAQAAAEAKAAEEAKAAAEAKAALEAKAAEEAKAAAEAKAAEEAKAAAESKAAEEAKAVAEAKAAEEAKAAVSPGTGKGKGRARQIEVERQQREAAAAQAAAKAKADAKKKPWYSRLEGDDAPCDLEKVEKMLAERSEAKRTKEFEKADELRVTLSEMGISIDDRTRTWYVRTRPDVSFSRRKDDNTPIDVEKVTALVNERANLRLDKEYAKADKIKFELWDMGVNLDDAKKEWYVGKVKNAYSRKLGDIAPVDVEKVESMLSERADAKFNADYKKADEVEAALKKMGVVVFEKDKQWFVEKRIDPSDDGIYTMAEFMEYHGDSWLQKWESATTYTGNMAGPPMSMINVFKRQKGDDAPCKVEPEKVQMLLMQRKTAKIVRNFRMAQRIETVLRALGVIINDNKDEWYVQVTVDKDSKKKEPSKEAEKEEVNMR